MSGVVGSSNLPGLNAPNLSPQEKVTASTPALQPLYGPWEKLALLGINKVEVSAGRTPEYRLEHNNTLVRLRGAVRVQTGATLAASASFAQGNFPTLNGGPPLQKITIVAVNTSAQILVFEQGTGELKITSVAVTEGQVIFLDNVIVDITA